MRPTIHRDMMQARVADCTARPSVTRWPVPPVAGDCVHRTRARLL